MEGTERGQVIRIFLRGTSGVKSSPLRQLAVHLTWKKLGETGEVKGAREAGGKDHSALRTSKQNQKKQDK